MPWTIVVNPGRGPGPRPRSRCPPSRALAASAGLDAEVVASESAERRREARHRGRGRRPGSHCRAAATEPSGCSPASRPITSAASAIIPTGSGNDFAAALGYDRRSVRSTRSRAIAAGRDATVDLGVVNGRSYTCVTCSGFDAEANRWANTVTRLSGTALYVAAVMRTLAVYRPCPFRITVDGEVFETPAWIVAVGNSRAYAGGMHIVPNARMDDGLLDVCVIGDLSRLQILRHFPKVFRGSHLGVPGVTTYRGSHVTVEAIGRDRHGGVGRRRTRRARCPRRWNRAPPRCASGCRSRRRSLRSRS